ncbi:hypothetical protein AACH06_27020 [Ideonella sp. DXS29W]|uniref:Uncharacterized protein n=1 Tax=Ideonella lacteola TaxID=2984193 RepID=A0ABU9C1C9_9BURK
MKTPASRQGAERAASWSNHVPASASPPVALAAAATGSRVQAQQARIAQLHAIAPVPASTPVVQRDVDKSSGTLLPSGVMRVVLKKGRALGMNAGSKAAPTVNATVTYTPHANAADADPIRLVQIVRTENPETHAIGSWAHGNEARRDKTQTQGEQGSEPGWFVDHTADSLSPRQKPTDSVVPDAYIDASFEHDHHGPLGTPKKSYKALGGSENVEGKKAGATITPASLGDSPSSEAAYDFRAEVVAKGLEVGGEQIYGRALWSFRTGPNGKGGQKITAHDASFALAPTANFQPAVDKYDEVYRNPTAETSPENVERHLAVIESLTPSGAERAQSKEALGEIVARVHRNAATTQDGIRAQMLEFAVNSRIQQAEAPPVVPRTADQAHPRPQVSTTSVDDQGIEWQEFTGPTDTGSQDDWADFDGQ